MAIKVSIICDGCVVASMEWHEITNYRVAHEKGTPVHVGMLRDLLLSFFNESNLKPGKIIFYRNIFFNISMLIIAMSGSLVHATQKLRSVIKLWKRVLIHSCAKASSGKPSCTPGRPRRPRHDLKQAERRRRILGMTEASMTTSKARGIETANCFHVAAFLTLCNSVSNSIEWALDLLGQKAEAMKTAAL
uniref:Uncharacterized protein n=1 Tax=Aegilops tauschii TaxID=37682 RepID=M8C6Y5_AEGTA